MVITVAEPLDVQIKKSDELALERIRDLDINYFQNRYMFSIKSRF